MKRVLAVTTLVGTCIEFAYTVLVGVWFTSAIFGTTQFVSNGSTIYFNAPPGALSAPYAKLAWSFAIIMTFVLLAYTIGMSLTRWFSTRFAFFLWGVISFAGAGAAIATVVEITRVRSEVTWSTPSNCVAANFDATTCLSPDTSRCQIEATAWCSAQENRLLAVLCYSSVLIFLRFGYGLLTIWLILAETLRGEDNHNKTSFRHMRSVSLDDHMGGQHVHHHHHGAPPPHHHGAPPPHNHGAPPPHHHMPHMAPPVHRGPPPSSDITITMGPGAGQGGGWNIQM